MKEFSRGASQSVAGLATDRRPSPFVIAGTIAAVLLVLFARRPGAFVHPQFWAEDGAIFFNYADRYGWAAMTMPYAGYHHFLLRLVSCAAARLDPLWVPAVYFWASTLVIGTLAGALFSRRLDLPHPFWLALAVVLVPHTGEVFNNLTNAQWPAALALVLLLVARDATTGWQWLVDALIAILVGLTGVFSLIFAPLFIARAAWRRTRAAWIIAALVAVPAAVQAYTVLHEPAPVPASPALNVAIVARIVVQRISGVMWLAPSLGRHLPATWFILIGLTCAALIAWAGLRNPKYRETTLLLWGCLAFVQLAVIHKFGSDFRMLGDSANGERYFFLPRVLLLWLCIFAWDAKSPGKWVARTACILTLLTSVVAFRFTPYRDYNWPYWAAKLRAHEAVVVPVNPDGFSFTHPGHWPP